MCGPSPSTGAGRDSVGRITEARAPGSPGCTRFVVYDPRGVEVSWAQARAARDRVWSRRKHLPQVVLADSVPGDLDPVDQQHGDVMSVALIKGAFGGDVDFPEHEPPALTQPCDECLHLIAKMATWTCVQGQFHSHTQVAFTATGERGRWAPSVGRGARPFAL